MSLKTREQKRITNGTKKIYKNGGGESSEGTKEKDVKRREEVGVSE